VAVTPDGKRAVSASGDRTLKVWAQILNGQPVRPKLHNIQGIGAGFIPDTLDHAMVDAIELVTDEEAIETALSLARKRRPWWRCFLTQETGISARFCLKAW
jgi:cysteine synthase